MRTTNRPRATRAPSSSCGRTIPPRRRQPRLNLGRASVLKRSLCNMCRVSWHTVSMATWQWAGNWSKTTHETGITCPGWIQRIMAANLRTDSLWRDPRDPRNWRQRKPVHFPTGLLGCITPRGGYVIGQVWKDHNAPDPTAAKFPDGTVSCKLLFTTATAAQMPYLKNDFEWQADVSLAGSTKRSIQTVRLLQIDVAVRDTRADSTTGLVFGTFVYDGNAAGSSTPPSARRNILAEPPG
jgi:hypothetical protein